MTSSGFKAQIMNAYDLDSEPTHQISTFAHKTHTNHQHPKVQLPHDSDQKSVIHPENARHGEVDQGIRPRYKDVKPYSHNKPNKPSSPKPKEGSKSPSHSEATKKPKCASMKGVSIDDPRPTFKRYKLVL
ncbi:hypothetical protein B0T13DRAFT_444698 [Neurospora crassa]|nr:hypothetical protein B0T13DRAFT_444698 [Neurospora crassa]